MLASRIPGSVGILGEDYSGYFEPGETLGLARLLSRAETDKEFPNELKERCRRLIDLFDPEHEEGAWRILLSEIVEAFELTDRKHHGGHGWRR